MKILISTAIVLCGGLTVGCRTSAAPEPVAHSSGSDAKHHARVEQSEPDVVEHEVSAADAQPPELECTQRTIGAGNCLRDAGCVVQSSQCRDIANDCERVTPVTRRYQQGPQTTFRGGDPCAVVDSRCAYDARTALCQPFVPVTACPATKEDATKLRVFCMHPKQAALTCPYIGGSRASRADDITFDCAPPDFPPQGRRPQPGSRDVPTTWTGHRHYDDSGCPTFSTSRNARCTAPRALQCRSRLTIYQCIRHRWRRTRTLPPPP